MSVVACLGSSNLTGFYRLVGFWNETRFLFWSLYTMADYYRSLFKKLDSTHFFLSFFKHSQIWLIAWITLDIFGLLNWACDKVVFLRAELQMMFWGSPLTPATHTHSAGDRFQGLTHGKQTLPLLNLQPLDDGFSATEYHDTFSTKQNFFVDCKFNIPSLLFVTNFHL